MSQSIQWGVDNGLLKGYPDQTFKPNTPMAEEHFVRVIARYAYGYPGSLTTSQLYQLIEIDGVHSFDGIRQYEIRKQPITRMTVARNLYAMANSENANVSDQTVIEWMYKKQLTSGKGIYPHDKIQDFGKNDYLTRAQVTAFLKRYDEKIKYEESFSIKIAGFSIGEQIGKKKAIIGTPQRIVRNEQQQYWRIHHQQYNNFYSWSEDDGKIISLFTNSDLYRSDKKVKIGMTRTEIEAIEGKPDRIFENKRIVYVLEDEYLTYFFDFLDHEKLVAVLIHSKELPNHHSLRYAPSTKALAYDNEQFLFDLINSTRVKNNLPPLTWNESISIVAKNHSLDMVNKDYFSHTSPEGVTFATRVKDANIPYRYAAENLSSGYVGPIFSHYGLMNSASHRLNILSPRVEEIGIGVHFNERHIPKYTENYLLQK